MTLTEEQIKDFTKLANTLQKIADGQEDRKVLNGKYRTFIDQHEKELRRGVTIGNLHLRLDVKKTFAVELLPSED
ncbi:MAG: hypothetical protein MJ240_08940 [Kiritimatiellae bacterium]|nr:hypothetical protein [Kiritimatiellia bacterium]